MTKDRTPRIAIVHDWLYGGGAELVVLELHKLFPEAPIYTSYCTKEWKDKLDNKVVTGYLQNWPFIKLYKFLPALRQRWFKKLNLSDYDIVISSSGNGEAKFVKVKKPAIHICYCHTPPHFYWRKYNDYLKQPGFKPEWLARLGLRLLLKPLRNQDYKAAQNVDFFIANSNHIQKDIQAFYDRESEVIHPPVETEKFRPLPKVTTRREGFVTWGRHVPNKRMDIAIEACNTLKLPLVVIGTGTDTPRLKRLAGPTVTFPGRVTDEVLVEYARTAEGFIFPGEDDFGIAPVEALAAGTPVIAYKSGGALDYIIEGKTGEFFTEQTTQALKKALENFNGSNYNPVEVSKHADAFSASVFQKKMRQLVSKVNQLKP